MRNIELRFQILKQQHPNRSTLLVFSEAVDGAGTNPEQVEFYFHKLVDKSDYSRADREMVLNDLKEKNARPGLI